MLFSKIPKATVGELTAKISERLRNDSQGESTKTASLGGADQVLGSILVSFSFLPFP